MPSPKLAIKYYLMFFIVPISAILDQWTKHIIMDRFYYGETMTIIPSFFNLVHVRNTGAAFSLLRDSPTAFREPFLLSVPVIALVVILVLFIKLKKEQLWLAVAFSLVGGGAIGNLIDRFRFGYVIDFLDFHWKDVYHWPAFNVADSCIVVGVSMLFLDSFCQRKICIDDSPKDDTSPPPPPNSPST